MVMDVNQTYYGDHFVICTNIESLSCTPETNVMVYVNYTSVVKKIKRNTTLSGVMLHVC